MKAGIYYSVPLLMLLISACTRSELALTVQSDYVSHENLASYYVNTPDPRLNNPSIGQRLIISWVVPKKYLRSKDLHLEIRLRFRNRKEILKILPITKSFGTYVYALMNEDYLATGGILTYKIELMADQDPIRRWQHQIWTEVIQIEHSTSPIECNELNEDFD